MKQKRGEISSTVRKDFGGRDISIRELILKRCESEDIPIIGKQESFLAEGRGFIEVICLHPHCSDQGQEEMRSWSEATGAHLVKALGGNLSRHPSH